MKFISKIHGQIEYSEKNIVTFNKCLPGFDNLTKFILIDLKEYEPFKLLQSLENDEISLILTSPYEFYNEYEIKLSEELLKSLNIENQEQVLVLTTVTLNSDLMKITTNLQGPIIINISNNFGEQIVLADSEYKVKSPLVKEE